MISIAPLESLSTKDGFKSMRAYFGALVPSIACFTDLSELQQAYFSQSWKPVHANPGSKFCRRPIALVRSAFILKCFGDMEIRV